jgi:hypothetical protein
MQHSFSTAALLAMTTSNQYIAPIAQRRTTAEQAAVPPAGT